MRMPQRILNAWRGQRHSLIFPLNIILFVLENGAVEKLSLTNSLDWSVVRIPMKLSYTLCQNISWVSAAQKPSLSRVWSGADATALCMSAPTVTLTGWVFVPTVRLFVRQCTPGFWPTDRVLFLVIMLLLYTTVYILLLSVVYSLPQLACCYSTVLSI